tara:strand:- start:156 stop:1064 length:909 start_codon:yes stop_codon:yes gene_type:complete
MLIANRYRLTEKIYEGNCSSVYIGKNVIKKEDVIIKLEDSSRMNLLEHEAGIYLHLMKQKNKINIPKFKMFGVLQKYNYIILEKMQYNFTDIIKENDLSLEDIYKIGVQLLIFLENFHKQSLIHRDIKPENIVFDKKYDLYLIDYGISTTYKKCDYINSFDSPNTREFREYYESKGKNNFVGNVIFSSTYSHDGYDYYPKDDLISVSYLLIYLYYKKLPWTIFNYINKNNKEKIIKALKKNIDFIDFFKNEDKIFDETLFKFYCKVNNFSFDTRINYNELKNMLLDKLVDKNIKNFSWSKCD